MAEVKCFGDNIYKNMFSDVTLLYFYIKDELNKADRLIRYAGDFRSACLKAAAISEILMSTRLWIISDAALVHGLPKFLKKEIPSIEMNTMLWVLRGKKAKFKGKENALSLNLEHKCLKEHQKKKISKLGDQGDKFHKLLDSIDKLALFRNKVVHGFMPVSKSMAEKAYEISRSSTEEFLEGWMDSSDREGVKDGIYEIIPWSELRGICHLDFILEVK